MIKKEKPIFVTQPNLPPIDELTPYLRKIWDNKILTNGGPLHQELESELCKYLGVEHISLFNNGTIALITALQALKISGQVITTPYSFVATSHALKWVGAEPIFVDIDPNTLNIDPNKIEAAITPETTAILAVHCYGHMCDVDKIEKIANSYGLKVIYDAAHAFGVNCHCGSILNHGDLSVLSFHATKVFNTFEGGAIVCKDLKTKKHIDNLKNFGYLTDAEVVTFGINGKMSEVSAAMGLLQLRSIDQLLESRGKVDQHYRTKLSNIKGIKCVDGAGESKFNYAYFPILVTEDYPLTRDELFDKLKSYNVIARRYFWPLISDFMIYRNYPSATKENLPVANKTSNQIICLPIYPDLSLDNVDYIADIIRG